MEEFPTIVRNKLGLALTSQELTKLFLKYYNPATNTVDYEKLTSDLTKVDGNEILTRKEAFLSITQILIKIRTNLMTKLDQWKEGDKLKNAYRLLSHSRSSVVDRAQLKNALQYRLFLVFSDKEIDEIFKKFDPYGTGTISIQYMINTIIRSDTPSTSKNVASVDVGFDNQDYKIKNFNADKNQNAIYTYDKKFIGLSPPDAVYCLKITVAELEDIIREKISERSSLSSTTIQTLTKLFGDGHNSTGYHYISKDQMRYTIWKKLKLNVSDELINQIFNKYDRKRSGQVLMFDFIDGIIRTNQKNEPILDDRFLTDSKSMAMKFKKNGAMKELFILVRDKINDLINRDSRAPHYLFHSVSKMTKGQAYEFFIKRLNLDLKAVFPGSDLLGEMDVEYSANGLIDVKRILIDAMSISETVSIGESAAASQSEGKVGNMWGNTNNLSLRNGSVVDVNRMPLSLQEMRLSPKDIGGLIFSKCLERMKHNHPLSSLHRILREAENDSDPRVITRTGLKHVLRKFDIIMNESDFNDFFQSHDRGDGKINGREFLDSLNPKSNYDQNPLLPKDEEGLKNEHNVARALEKITGRRREVSVMNGSTNTRLDGEIIHSIAKSTPKDEEPSAPVRHTVATPPPTSKPNRPVSMRTMRSTTAISVPESQPQREPIEAAISSQGSGTIGPEVNDTQDSSKDDLPRNSNSAPPMSPKSAKLFHALQAAVKARKVRQAKQKKKIDTPTFRPAHSHQYHIDLNALLEGKFKKNEEQSTDWNRSVRPNSAASTTPQKVLLRINTFNKRASMKNLDSSNQKPASSTTNPANRSAQKMQVQGKSRNNIFESTVVRNDPTPPVVHKEARDTTTNNNNSQTTNNNTNDTITNNNNYYNEVSTVEQLMEQLLSKRKASKGLSSSTNTTTNNNNSNNNNIQEPAFDADRRVERSNSGVSGPAYSPAKVAQRSESIVLTPHSPNSPRSSTQTPRSAFSRPSTAASPTKTKSPFVYTGQRRQFVPSPFSTLLHLKYKMDKKHLVTSHEDYGMFVKSVNKAAKSQQLLGKKFKATLSPSYSSKM